ncbi:aminotransferase class V-fold PLP-dependent enzyme [Rudaea cellulosilytica]|uniref:aminotransferase class V-fold PLP-dependent enzyme n=1 Tax=Rudaea cellulosilytica TaxID=540746 RepID=UPI00035D4995|nr:aminotransferase class V-fold PLP-dependent enzyme [Rudaea cellulosilytica]
MTLSRREFIAANGALLGAAVLPRSLLAEVEARSAPMPALKDWNQIRRQFRLTPEYLHFSGFYIASHPQVVREAIESFRNALDANPFLTVEHGMFESEAQNLQEKVRVDIAAYLGGKPDEIALTPNTTTGLALVYHGLPLKSGDEVLVTTHDHVVHHEAIRLSTERNGASVRKITLFDDAARASAEAIVSRVREGIGPKTRVLGITWVHSATGIRLPVRQIADAVGEINSKRDEKERMVLVVDGVHGIGAVDATIADLGADFFCAGTHKWMFAPRGTGIVWARAQNWARLRPLIPSFSDLEVYEAWTEQRPVRGPTVAARVSPGGFLAYEHQWAMGTAFRMHQQIGRARIAQRVAELNGRCKDGLSSIKKVRLITPRDASLSAGINCFEVAGQKPGETVKRLLERKIIASESPYAKSYARLSAGLMNTPEQVDQAVAAVRAIAG